jgi:hypothetical protein
VYNTVEEHLLRSSLPTVRSLIDSVLNDCLLLLVLQYLIMASPRVLLIATLVSLLSPSPCSTKGFLVLYEVHSCCTYSWLVWVLAELLNCFLCTYLKGLAANVVQFEKGAIADHPAMDFIYVLSDISTIVYNFEWCYHIKGVINICERRQLAFARQFGFAD